jgi:hypothetical protein
VQQQSAIDDADRFRERRRFGRLHVRKSGDASSVAPKCGWPVLPLRAGPPHVQRRDTSGQDVFQAVNHSKLFRAHRWLRQDLAVAPGARRVE